MGRSLVLAVWAILLLSCLISNTQGVCNPQYNRGQCAVGNVGGAFRKSLLDALLERRTTDLAELDDRTLKRALDLLLEEERRGDEEGENRERDEQQRAPPVRSSEEKAREFRYEKIRELLDKLLDDLQE